MAKAKPYPVPAAFRYQDSSVPVSMAQLIERDKFNNAALTDRQIVDAHARFMYAQEFQGYQAWAKTNPTADHRMYAPLVNYVDPFSASGQAVTYGGVAAAAANNSLGRSTIIAGTSNPLPSTVTASTFANATSPFTPGGAGGTAVQATSANPAEQPNLLEQTLGTTEHVLGSVNDLLTGAVTGFTRTAIAAASTPYDFGQGNLRATAANFKSADDLGQKYGLTDEEKAYIQQDPGTDQASVQAAVAGQAPGAAGGAGATAHDLNAAYDAADPERKKVLDQARQEYLATPTVGTDNIVKSSFDSTMAGQAIAHPDLLLGGGPEAQGFLPSTKLNELMDTNSAKVYDIMRPDERLKEAKAIQAEELAKGNFYTLDQTIKAVAPVAWTPGRVLAHQKWSVDETAFHTVSGLVDMGINLTTDPINLLPAPKGEGVLTKIASAIPGTTAHALTLGEKATLVTKVGTAFAKPGEEAVTHSLDGVPEALRGRDAVTAAEKAAGKPLERVYDKSLPDHVIDAETGTVRGPHGLAVMSDRAWSWVNGPKGSKVVNALTSIDSQFEIMLRSGRKMDPQLAGDLARATTDSQVRAILATRMGIDISKPSEFGSLAHIGRPSIFGSPAMIDNGVLQAFRVAPRANAHIDLNATEDAVYQLEAWARGIGMPVKDVIPHLDNFMASHGDIDRYNTLYGVKAGESTASSPGLLGAAATHLAGDLEGKSKDEVALAQKVARHLTTAFEGGLNPAHRRWVNSQLGDNAFGAEGDMGRALLETEHLSRTAILPDYRTIQRWTGFIGKMSGAMSADPAKIAMVDDSNIGDLLNLARTDRKAFSAHVTDMTLDGLQGMTSAWRNLVLVRPAYTLREMIDLSVAMGLAGYGGPFVHPVAFMGNALIASLSKDAATRSVELAAKIPRGLDGALHLPALREYVAHTRGLQVLAPRILQTQARVNGQEFWRMFNEFIASDKTDFEKLDDLTHGLSAVHGNFNIDQGAARSGNKYVEAVSKMSEKDRSRYAEMLAQKILAMSKDRDMRNLAGRMIDDGNGGERPMTFQEALDSFRTGTREMKMAQRPDLLDPSNATLDVNYLNGYADILQRLTMDDPVIRAAVATGKHEGESLSKGTMASGTWNRVNPTFRKYLEDKLTTEPDYLAHMPSELYAPARGVRSGGLGRMLNNIASEFFSTTGDVTDMLVRSPVLRQAYADRVISVGAWMSPEAKGKIVENLRLAGDQELARKVSKVKAVGHLGVDEVDAIASSYARKETERIFYDATRRQNYAFAGRVLLPFLQATTNTFRRWGQMSLENPQMMYRTIKPLYYGEQPGSAAIYGLMGQTLGNDSMDSYFTPGRPDHSVNGFFYEDEYGARKFAYPMISPVIAAMGLGLNSPIPAGLSLNGTMGGLNVAGQTINPGTGPMATFAASIFAENLISRKGTLGDTARAIFPYSLPTGTVMEKAFNSFTPIAYQKLNNAQGDEQLTANLTMKLLPILQDTGHYDVSTETGKRQMVKDAQDLASRLFTITAIGGMVTPTQITPQMAVEVGPDNARHLMLLSEVSKEFQKYQQNTPDYFAATQAFVEDYGVTAMMSLMPRVSTDGPQSTNDVWTFRDQNPTSYQSHRTVLGYFFAGGDGNVKDPTDPRGYAAPLRHAQQVAGESVYNDPETFLDQAQLKLGWILWDAKTQQIAQLPNLSSQQRDQLRSEYKAEVSAKYPHWTGDAADPSKFAVDLRDVREALKDPAIQGLSSAPYIQAYLDARDQVLSDLAKRGVKSLTATGSVSTGAGGSVPLSANGAATLKNIAYQLMAKDGTGAFARTYNALFSRELP
jgi:hypothetical protein